MTELPPPIATRLAILNESFGPLILLNSICLLLSYFGSSNYDLVYAWFYNILTHEFHKQGINQKIGCAFLHNNYLFNIIWKKISVRKSFVTLKYFCAIYNFFSVYKNWISYFVVLRTCTYGQKLWSS